MSKRKHLLSILKTLRDARNLLEVRGSWCQHTSARNKDNKSVDATSQEAVKWCATGAIERVGKNPSVSANTQAFLDDFVSNNTDAYDTVQYNDNLNNKNKAQIINLFDRAISCLTRKIILLNRE